VSDQEALFVGGKGVCGLCSLSRRGEGFVPRFMYVCVYGYERP
jgi:hypothetical protein